MSEHYAGRTGSPAGVRKMKQHAFVGFQEDDRPFRDAGGARAVDASMEGGHIPQQGIVKCVTLHVFGPLWPLKHEWSCANAVRRRGGCAYPEGFAVGPLGSEGHHRAVPHGGELSQTRQGVACVQVFVEVDVEEPCVLSEHRGEQGRVRQVCGLGAMDALGFGRPIGERPMNGTLVHACGIVIVQEKPVGSFGRVILHVWFDVTTVVFVHGGHDDRVARKYGKSIRENFLALRDTDFHAVNQHGGWSGGVRECEDGGGTFSPHGGRFDAVEKNIRGSVPHLQFGRLEVSGNDPDEAPHGVQNDVRHAVLRKVCGLVEHGLEVDIIFEVFAWRCR